MQRQRLVLPTCVVILACSVRRGHEQLQSALSADAEYGFDATGCTHAQVKSEWELKTGAPLIGQGQACVTNGGSCH